MNHPILRLAATWIALVFLALPAARAADPFYLDLLDQGARDYAVRDFDNAARKLRIACFGMLDEPDLLAQGLVRLALAQIGAGDREGVGESFARLLEVENRFAAYSSLAEIPELKAELERALPQWVDDAYLARAPVFAEMLEHRKEAELEALPPARRRKALTRRLKQNPNDTDALIRLTELDATEGRTRPARKRLDKILELDPEDPGALCARGRLALATSDCEAAAADLASCAQPLEGLATALEECRLRASPGEPSGETSGETPQTSPARPATEEKPAAQTLEEPIETEPLETGPIEAEPAEAEPAKAEAVEDPPTQESPVPAPREPQPNSTPDAAPDPAEMVSAWAQAWSDQRIDDYLSFYSTDFVPSRGRSREEWIAQRRRDLAEPQNLKVSAQIQSTRANGNLRTVSFSQSYVSDLLSYDVRKVLDLRWEDGNWKIVRESPNP